MRKGLVGVITALALSMLPVLTACPAQEVDYVSQCKLESSISYTQNTFLDNGIGEVTLKATVDGDTAHFYQKEVDESKISSKGFGRVVKVRFYGIDTPESTGKIEPFGKMASEFTKTKLLNAKTIVLSIDLDKIGQSADFDSTGSRYVGFVWVSEKENCPQNELQLLNLWVVQEGYSNAKSIVQSPIGHYFIDADMQAQKLHKGMWNTDPNADKYPIKSNINETDIKTLMDSFAEDGEDSPWCNEKVGVTGTVYRVANTDCYLNTWVLDPITNTMQQYGLYIFAGYKNYRPLKQLGAVIHVIGTFQVHYGNPQITNVAYDSLHPTDDCMSIVTPAPEDLSSINIPTVPVSEVNDNKINLNRIVRLEGLHATGGYDERDATTLVKSGAFSVYAKDNNDNEITFRVTKDVWAVDEDDNRIETYQYFTTEGLTFDVVGAIALFESQTTDRVTYQITLVKKTDLTIHKPVTVS